MCGEKLWCVTPLWQFISSHQSTFLGENRGVSFDFLTRVSFVGGTGEFSHQSILPGGTGEFLWILSPEYLSGENGGRNPNLPI